jgi:tetratricopeptide (TPR) repeat protein
MKGDIDKGKEDIDLSISLDPYNAWAYRNKGLYYLMTNNTKEAIRLLEQAVDMDPFVENLYLYLGRAYLTSGDKGKACASFIKSFERMELTKAELEKHCPQ